MYLTERRNLRATNSRKLKLRISLNKYQNADLRACMSSKMEKLEIYLYVTKTLEKPVINAIKSGNLRNRLVPLTNK